MRTKKRCIFAALSIASCQGGLVHPQSIDHPALNVSANGQVALVGSFDSLSTFDYVGQNSVLQEITENDRLISQPSDAWQYYLAADFADGSVSQACLLENGAAIIAGNFSKIRGTDALGIARLDLQSGAVSSLGNISLQGAVRALWCNDTLAYVGGNLQLADSQGLGVWNDTSSSWTLPQFGGFPLGSMITAITPLNNDSVLFGGDLGAPLYGSSTKSNGTQQVGLAAASISAIEGANDPTLALCMSDQPFNAVSGSKGAVLNLDLARTIELSQIALANPNSTDGVQTFNIISHPSNSIMNLSYTSNGKTNYCDASCPLEINSENIFSFVNPVGTRNLSISLLSYYGDHASLMGLQLYTTQSMVYANNELNSPRACQDVHSSSYSTLQGDWQRNDDHEVAHITSGQALQDTYIRYYPNVSSSGNFSLQLWTPGCVADNSCSTRGQVNITVYPGPSDEYPPTSMQVFQTNNEVKYDPIYNGTLVRTTDFQPYVEVRPVPGQQTPLDFAASQLQLNFVSAGPNIRVDKLFEFSISNYTRFSQDSSFQPIGDTPLNRLGNNLGNAVSIDAISTFNDSVYIGGNFSQGSLISYNTKNNAVQNVSTDGHVYKLYTYNEDLFAIQDYNSVHNVSDSYKNIYNKPVSDIVLFNLNGSSMLAFSVPGSSENIDLWNVSAGDWYDGNQTVSGHISETLVYNSSNFYFGSIRTEEASAGGAAAVNGDMEVSSLPFQLGSQNSSSLSKRDGSDSQNSINAGVFYGSANILGGHFTATTSDNQQARNLLMIDGDSSSALPTDGLDDSSEITSMAIYQDTLVLVGSLSGSYNTMALYDLKQKSFASQQPSGVSGNVNTVVGRGDSVVLLGSFSAGDCSDFCIYNITANSWTSPKKPSSGQIRGATSWSGNELVLYGENLAIDGGSSNLVQYQYNQDGYTAYTNTGIDGNITGATVDFNDQNTKFLAVSWTNSTNGHNIQWFDGRSWTSSSSPLGGNVTSLSIMHVVSQTSNSSIPLGSGKILAVNGDLNLPNLGNTTVASFDGENWQPLFVASKGDGPGSVNAFYSQNQVPLGDPSAPQQSSPTASGPRIRHLMSKGKIVGISFAIALGCLLLLVIMGLIWGYATQRKQYQATPQRVDGQGMQNAVPPEMIMAM